MSRALPPNIDAPRGSKAIRLFVAVDLPPDVRDALAEAVAPLREDFPKARWVPPQNWHVTLKFLGSAPPELVDRVSAAVGSVAADAAPFEAHLRDLGAFPNERRGRVLWAGLVDPEDRLAALASELDHALEPEFEVDERGFTAHLTIARFDPLVPLGPMLAAIAVPDAHFVVDHLALYRSHLRRPTPFYESLGTWRLTAGPGNWP
jgi:2'-5' RNA ligase